MRTIVVPKSVPLPVWIVLLAMCCLGGEVMCVSLFSLPTLLGPGIVGTLVFCSALILGVYLYWPQKFTEQPPKMLMLSIVVICALGVFAVIYGLAGAFEPRFLSVSILASGVIMVLTGGYALCWVESLRQHSAATPED